MQTPTAQEQLMLELTNRVRSDPGGEVDRLIPDLDTRTSVDAGVTNALRFFDVDMDMLVAQMATFDPVAPLAWNMALAQSADTHSQLMIDTDTQSHSLPGEPGLLDRMRDAGYDNLSRVGENIFAYTDSAIYGHAGFIIDWGYGPGGMQDPAGHRNSLLSANFTEIGLSMLEETDGATRVGPFVVTQHLGNRWDYAAQLVGVVIDDTDNDDFYDIGEGLGGITVTATGAAGTFTTTTWDAGGYQMELAAGTYEVTFSGGGLAGTITETVTIGSDNIKLDAEAEDAVIAGNVLLVGDAGDNTLRGGDGDDTLDGGAGADVLIGGGGIDTVTYASATWAIRLDLQTDATTYGDARGDTYQEIEIFRAGSRNDFLRGDSAGNIFFGDGGWDKMYGRAGNDTMDGGTGSDVLYGNAGADVMTGGGDAAQRDRFVYFNTGELGVWAGQRDVITDFVSGVDRIEISRLDADLTRGLNQAFDFVGDAAFSNTAGELRYTASGGITVVQADTDGDGVADFEIELTGTMSLVETDFLL